MRKYIFAMLVMFTIVMLVSNYVARFPWQLTLLLVCVTEVVVLIFAMMWEVAGHDSNGRNRHGYCVECGAEPFMGHATYCRFAKKRINK